MVISMNKVSEYMITIVIPIYNQEKNIKNCISSLQRQTICFSKMEVILINDGSTANSGSSDHAFR